MHLYQYLKYYNLIFVSINIDLNLGFWNYIRAFKSGEKSLQFFAANFFFVLLRKIAIKLTLLKTIKSNKQNFQEFENSKKIKVTSWLFFKSYFILIWIENCLNIQKSEFFILFLHKKKIVVILFL